LAVLQFLQTMARNLGGLGARRLIALGLVGLFVFLLVGVAGYVLSRPQREVLYAGLDPQDVSRIGAALEEVGVPFDVSVDGTAVLVDYGETAKARMMLAEKGLPKSDSAGYELFDKLGSLGLTSFMQQVTKVRALEGELARTIQLLSGIKAARVHLVLKDEGSFRGGVDKASASVVVRTDPGAVSPSADAIRHLVAAAIPGLVPQQVTVMSSDGRLLAASDDPVTAAPERLVALERSLTQDAEARITETLSPYLGVDNFRVSVTAKVNADRTEINETAFDPNSRVERSTRTIKESGEAQNASGQQAVTVDQNIPQEATPAAGGDNSREKKDRREELTNYEINSKLTATKSDGYRIDRMSVAVVVNRGRIAKALGDGATEEQIAAQISEIERLVASSAGLVTSRGDTITVSALDFISTDLTLEPLPGQSIRDILIAQLGSFVSAGAFILVALLVVFLGLRPALRSILEATPGSAPGNILALANAGPAVSELPLNSTLNNEPTDERLDEIARQVASTPQARLAKIVELDPDRAAHVLKQWITPSGKPAA